MTFHAPDIIYDIKYSMLSNQVNKKNISSDLLLKSVIFRRTENNYFLSLHLINTSIHFKIKNWLPRKLYITSISHYSLMTSRHLYEMTLSRRILFQVWKFCILNMFINISFVDRECHSHPSPSEKLPIFF